MLKVLVLLQIAALSKYDELRASRRDERGSVTMEHVLSTGFAEEVVGGADAVGLAALLGAGGSGALLRCGNGDRLGVVVERGLHAQEHDREECGQEDDELDRNRAPVAAQPAAAT